ncbi:PBP1A family penicillin-binding protein [Filobacillus milosensis]|uniref:PBP1A family penicillin-binding protein n=1 Tax=Filobacillus milosensis TaxID=94137 RepID=A0A4Y8IXA1_9BACI|nr:penicillin-binding protein 1A [Filobacillus milosensis]TFB23995.1 PBP1A family penicillin-binding protein [Filobacillus milosensis]
MSQDVKSRKAKKQTAKGNKKINWKKVLITLLIIGALGMFIVAGIVFSYIKDAPPLNAEELQVPLSTTILDRNGDVIAELGAQKRESIQYDDIPQVLEDAVLATEDVRFFEHSGIDLRRIGGAVIANLKEGFGAEGASTITQQVVKNAFLTREKSIERKIQEQYLAFKLEQQYSKKEIFTMYLNLIAYGKDIYGVQKASEAFYGKSDLSELTLPEAALLAGIPQRPNAYNPFIDPELAKQRRNTVLNLMVQHGKITEQQANEAKQVKIEDMVQDSYESNIPYEAFIEQVLIETGEHLDDEVDVYSAGLTIHTTLDPEAQKHLEFLLSDKESPIYFENKEIQAGVSAINTQTGEILAIGGGRNKEGIWGGMNYAINPEGRQPGSTIKPILDYGPAIEFEKWSTYHQLLDEEIQYGSDGNQKTLNNFDNRYRGWMTMREALYNSINVPAFKTFDEIRSAHSEEKILNFAEGLGLSFDNLYDSDSIGGNNQVNPLQLAGAYAAFGNSGIYNEPHAVTKIVYPEEQNVVEVKPESDIAMSDYTAYMITDMLKDVVTHGSGTRVNVGNLPVAAKTGTTNDAVDSWLVGYSTNFTIATWVGYPQNESLPNSAKNVPKDIFSNLMTFMSQDVETSDFKKPESVVEVGVEKGSRPAKLPSEYTPESEIVTELFVKGAEPTETSEKYDQLDPVTDLTAEFDKDSNTITVNWNHPMLDEENQNMSFRVRVSVDGSEMQDVGTVNETEIVFDEIAPGTSYTFEITAIDNENESNSSEPAETSVETPDEEADFWDDFLGDEEDKKDKDKDKKEDNDDSSQEDGQSDEEQNSDSQDDGSQTDDTQNDGSTQDGDGSTQDDSGSTEDGTNSTDDSTGSTDGDSSSNNP